MASSKGKETLLRFFKNKKVIVGIFVVSIYILLAFITPYVTKQIPYEINASNQLASISKDHLFGTDSMGRDVFARVLYGTRISLGVAVSVGIMSGIAGLIIGLSSGYFGGRFDLLVMRSIDVVMAFPWVLAALLLVTIIGPGLKTVIIALAIIYTPGMIRVVRSKVLSVKEEKYVAAAEAIGESNLSVMGRYILPNCVGPILVQTTITMSWSILGEAGISYLGFGTQPPSPSWGLILADAARYMYTAPKTLPLIPGVVLLILVLGLNFMGDGIRDLLDPKFRGR